MGFLSVLLGQSGQQLKESIHHVLRLRPFLGNYCTNFCLVCFKDLLLQLELVSLSSGLCSKKHVLFIPTFVRIRGHFVWTFALLANTYLRICHFLTRCNFLYIVGVRDFVLHHGTILHTVSRHR